MNNKEVSIFCGGRGSSAIIKAILKYNFKKINIILNTYDDGLSTGAIRKLIPGIVGPSDIRKNVNVFLKYNKEDLLTQFLDFRLPDNSQIRILHTIIDMLQKNTDYLEKTPLNLMKLYNIISEIEFKNSDKIINFIFIFWKYFNKRKCLDVSDFTIGNIIFAGIYLTLKNNEKTIRQYTKLFINNSKFNIYDINCRGSLYLCALKTNGELLPDEYSITTQQSKYKISNLFFLKRPLSEKQIEHLNKTNFKINYLESLNIQPVISKDVKKALVKSSIIIYGPGTQHSSLYPSYMTKGVKEIIYKKKYTMKVFILNLTKDNDITSFSATDIIKGFMKYIGCNHCLHKFINYVLYTPLEDENALIKKDEKILKYYNNINWIGGNFTDQFNNSIHNGDLIIKTIINLYKVFREKQILSRSLYKISL